MPDTSEFTFDFEFLNQTNLPDAELYELAYAEITEIAEGHTDVVGASVSIEELSSGMTPHAFQARIVLYVRPEHIAATEIKPSALEALQRALDAAIKQVREKRDKLRNY
jgi:hypothetical protein